MTWFVWILCFNTLTAQDTPTLEQSIAAFQAQFIQSLKDGDATRNASFYNEDAFVLNPGQLVKGRDNIALLRRTEFDRVKVIHAVLRTLHLESSGDLAYEIGEFSYSLKFTSGEAKTVGGKYLMVWKRGKDGQWRYQADAGLAD